ncbi:oxygenase MpaB family protein [Streptomyces sp. NPDC048257]|uniref:oxygenase MpaB family protein n=1 Tax=Streptomyces sp. NPDC048257 TaxID=3365526 RepID=UPI0037238892
MSPHACGCRTGPRGGDPRGDRPDERTVEIARLERAHRRIRGADEAGRPYSAEDPEVRAW